MELVSLYKYTRGDRVHIYMSRQVTFTVLLSRFIYTADEFEIRLILEFNYVY